MSGYGGVFFIMTPERDSALEMTADFLTLNENKLKMQLLFLRAEQERVGEELDGLRKVNLFSKGKIKQLLLRRELSVLNKEVNEAADWHRKVRDAAVSLQHGRFDEVITFLGDTLSYSAPKAPPFPGGPGTPPPTLGEIYFRHEVVPGVQKMTDGLSATA